MAPPLLNWKVIGRKNLSHDVIELVVERHQGVEFRAGQYMSIVIPGAGPGGRNLRRAYSIASPPEQSTIEFCIKLVESGPGTSFLDSLQVGDSFQGQMPFGDFVLDHAPASPAVFISTGTGIAPARSMVLSNEWQPTGPVAFLMGVRHEKDVIYPELFNSSGPTTLKNQPHVKIAVSRPIEGWTGFKGRVTDYLRQMEWNFVDSHFYLCGNGEMIAEVKHILLKEKSVFKDYIHTEKYY